SGANAAPLFELPFMVQGSWDDPIILPDPQSRIQRSGAAQPILDAVRSRTSRDSVRSAIERLTGAAPALPSAETPAVAGASAPAQGARGGGETEPAPDSPPPDSRYPDRLASRARGKIADAAAPDLVEFRQQRRCDEADRDHGDQDRTDG